MAAHSLIYNRRIRGVLWDDYDVYASKAFKALHLVWLCSFKYRIYTGCHTIAEDNSPAYIPGFLFYFFNIYFYSEHPCAQQCV